MNSVESLPDATAADRVEALIEITESLNLIFEEENAAIEDRRPEDVEPYQAEKARLASVYAQSIRAMAADRKRVSAVDQGLLSRLHAVTTAFEASAAYQRALLDGRLAAASAS